MHAFIQPFMFVLVDVDFFMLVFGGVNEKNLALPTLLKTMPPPLCPVSNYMPAWWADETKVKPDYCAAMRSFGYLLKFCLHLRMRTADYN